VRPGWPRQHGSTAFARRLAQVENIPQQDSASNACLKSIDEITVVKKRLLDPDRMQLHAIVMAKCVLRGRTQRVRSCFSNELVYLARLRCSGLGSASNGGNGGGGIKRTI
jgi:hypothetical protein